MSDNVFIILFRGVGGATQLPVKPLREKLEAAGFRNVATYINSGNAVVASDLSREEAVARIAAICRKEFGFDKDIHAVTRQEWAKLIKANPFPEAVKTPKFLHAAVLASKPDHAKVRDVVSTAANGEGFAVVGKVAYIHTPNGFGTSKLAVKFDKGIGVPNTARNWNTVLKLAELAAAAAKPA